MRVRITSSRVETGNLNLKPNLRNLSCREVRGLSSINALGDISAPPPHSPADYFSISLKCPYSNQTVRVLQSPKGIRYSTPANIWQKEYYYKVSAMKPIAASGIYGKIIKGCSGRLLCHKIGTNFNTPICR